MGNTLADKREYLLIGSRALNYWCPEVPIKDTADFDIISKEPVEGAEHHQWELLDNYKLVDYTSSEHTLMFNDRVVHVVNPVGLAIVKRSHLWRDLGFNKHITHYWKYLAEHQKNMDLGDRILLEQRTELTHKMFPQLTPNLNQTVEQFFDDGVKKVHNHDYLHSLFAYSIQPMYTRLQTDKTKAWCSKELWEGLTHVEKLQCVAEEAYVISTERFLVPKNWEYPMKLAYMQSLGKICTTLCSGYFRDFAIDHYPEVLRLFNKKKFLEVKEKIETADSSNVILGYN